MFIILLVRFGLLSGHLLGISCPFGWPYVLIVFCLFVIFIYFPFGFKSGIWLLIAPIPVHCFSISFTNPRRDKTVNVGHELYIYYVHVQVHFVLTSSFGEVGVFCDFTSRSTIFQSFWNGFPGLNSTKQLG